MYKEHRAYTFPYYQTKNSSTYISGKCIARQNWIGTDNRIRDLGDLAATMGKLTASQIDEYFAIHLPYRTRILLAHYRMTRRPWIGDLGQLEAAFEASLITGRMYLNILGISKNRRDALVPPRIEKDDVSAVDLGGTPVDLRTLSPADVSLFTGFLKMADKGAAHLTMPMQHPVEYTHIAIVGICELVKAQLYDATGRTFEVTINRMALEDAATL